MNDIPHKSLSFSNLPLKTHHPIILNIITLFIYLMIVLILVLIIIVVLLMMVISFRSGRQSSGKLYFHPADVIPPGQDFHFQVFMRMRMRMRMKMRMVTMMIWSMSDVVMGMKMC